MTKTIRWGILGCGDVTEVKSGPALQQAEGSALVAVMRRDAAKAADYAKRHNVSKWYTDADELIADPQVDAVYVATPPDSHLDLALKVAAARKPCLVEKPMARNGEECRQMVAAFERAGVPLFVAYYRRALPAFVRAREIVELGTLGRISGVSIRFSRPSNPDVGWRIDPTVSGGGLFVDLASHALNAMEWIVGPFENATGQASGLMSDVDDVVTLHWRCRGDALGTASYNFASAVSEDVLEITGTRARLSWSCFGDGTIMLTHADGRVESERHPPGRHVHLGLIRTIISELNGAGRCPSDARSGMRTSELMDVALKPYYEARAKPSS
jgi:1,5-anhydro-D-fructose reductase (1,5-anhydro-D-mannitol-forming)